MTFAFELATSDTDVYIAQDVLPICKHSGIRIFTHEDHEQTDGNFIIIELSKYPTSKKSNLRWQAGCMPEDS